MTEREGLLHAIDNLGAVRMLLQDLSSSTSAWHTSAYKCALEDLWHARARLEERLALLDKEEVSC